MSDYFKEREREMNMRLRQLREELPEFAEEFFVGIEPRTTVLTRLNYAYDLRIFFDYLCRRVRCCRDKQPQDITLSDLEKLTTANLESYLEYLGLYTFEGKEYSNGERGKARKISTVRTFFKFFYNRDRLASDVAAKVSLPKLRDKEIIRLEGREIERILEAAEEGTGMSAHQHKIQRGTRERDGAILALLLGTGIRVSELVGLNVRDIDFESGAFTVTRKGGGRAILYFNDDVAEALTRYIEGERRRLAERAESKGGDEDALFLSMQARRMCVRAVENLVKKYAAVAAPLKTISPHKLRSTYGTNLYRATGDIYMVADVLGHRDVNTTKKHYAAIEIDRRKAAAKAVRLTPEEDED